MATAHIQAELGDIAQTVLMPGDPLRAKYLVETYLENPVQFNAVRNMLGYTGIYKGKKISIMGSGMGMPSIGIYSYELFSRYGVENIIRIGSAGSYQENIKVYDVVLADSSYSESTYAKIQSGYENDKTYPSEIINKIVLEKSAELQIPVVQTCVHSSDVFYVEGGSDYKKLVAEHNCGCVEMESFALFHNANVLGKHAACLLTISDSFITKEEISSEARQTSFDQMMHLALESSLSL
ncbi:purine-nucleoside phosphorylase [Apibacter sp. HY039]|uniref:purine-nucleoside phosphorylase n=1 Tax=Apibacter sp. HY039 TaxID=2501476 RepID=UPI000FEC1238|nr:purine-nucleoside phosphorylase [Apibacter sp. HY039]